MPARLLRIRKQLRVGQCAGETFRHVGLEKVGSNLLVVAQLQADVGVDTLAGLLAVVLKPVHPIP